MPHCVQAQRVRQRPLLALEHALDRALVTTLEHQVDRLVGTRVLPIRLNGKHAAVVPHLGTIHAGVRMLGLISSPKRDRRAPDGQCARASLVNSNQPFNRKGAEPGGRKRQRTG
ncbi:hypothetical protein HRbin30_00927 [bacterium HR30]|nr:hypothetical protein HRbin30_00927 [bacterium HR30]